LVAGAVGELIRSLALTEEERAEFDARTRVETTTIEANHTARVEEAERRAKKLREDLYYLSANKLSLLRAGAYTPEALAAEEAALAGELSALSSQEEPSVALAEDVAG